MAERLEICSDYIGLGFKVSQVLRYAGVASSTWYYHQANKNKADGSQSNAGRPVPGYSLNPDGTVVLDSAIVLALKGYRESPFFQQGGGYHKLKYYLRRDYGYYVNHKKVYRLCKAHDFLLPRKLRKKSWHATRVSMNREIYKPNQLWSFDIKYGYIHGLNRFFFILAYLDIYSRRVVDYYVGLTCKSHNLSATLDFALAKENITGEGLTIRSDNGPQMTSNQFRAHLEAIGGKITHEFIPCATPNKNAHIESFFSIVEKEFISVHYFKDFKSVAEKFHAFVTFYNHDRIHGSLGFKTPKEIVDDYKQNGYNPQVKNLRV